MKNDTVFAPAGAVGGAVCVIRISGPDTCMVEKILSAEVVRRPGMLVHTEIRKGDAIADDGMAVFFKAPRSYTGEDMAEIHCHGGGMTVKRVLESLSDLGFLPAPGGEFTKRAFLNGKMDLSSAEAVMDVIRAEADRGLTAALRQLKGSLKNGVEELEDLLLNSLSGIDAAIDYPDEAEEEAYSTVSSDLTAVEQRLCRMVEDGRKGRILRDGIHVVICGKPNVGKSSLLNLLLGEDRAIVTDIAGTTRDVLDVKTVIRGVSVRLFDTAGFREASDTVERIGVERAMDALHRADIVLLVLDGSLPLSEEDRLLLDDTTDAKRIILINKSDLPVVPKTAAAGGPDAIRFSAKTGEGQAALCDRLMALSGADTADASEVTNERHLRALSEALSCVREALTAEDLDCKATDIRSALHHLGEITGRDADADLIDRIFMRFCVGK